MAVRHARAIYRERKLELELELRRLRKRRESRGWEADRRRVRSLRMRLTEKIPVEKLGGVGWV